ncbi:exodeoxyribonuclease VII small subunit [Nesterenkonia aerolata]|uniref:Exodeoxyribonuclease 7 small subunit n=1 Tax=Nesterenkonia aerolata TaxID=3074079 RepID=A0ABU2DSL6_9MICC|nr:exodeoxyribonuclease VII small subunit [Nesterenkonia sp. LY-0111]MDR8019376.1 exodeoxyribonuclease VII small subunit [Nesterenkonia sp. LY-0111]
MTQEQDAGQQDRQDEQGFAQVRTEDIETMSYEQAREELVSVVQQLETGGVPLEQSLALWQRGEALADRCERWLDGARSRLEEVRRSLDDDDEQTTSA